MLEGQQWEISRVGLINFWYYDEQFFEFADGKLLLRGSNGSGKSVTMQSLLPVLLDGRTTANRLDSFGSRDRRMEDYLLGEEEVSSAQERTGYLMIEYRRKGQNRYVTTGIGLQARRGDTLNKWFFAITDNRRVGHDFSLFDQSSGDRGIPLSKRQLINRLEDGGQLFSKPRDYQQFVNETIFGFENLAAFDDCIKLLIQLRSPKLSKEFRPSVIYEILTNALPSLKEDDLLPLSRTLEQIDSSRSRLEQFEREQQALKKLTVSYERMYRERLTMIADRRQDYGQKVKTITAEHQVQLTLKSQCQERLAELTEERRHLLEQLVVWQEEQDELKGHEAYQLLKRAEELKQQLTYNAQDLASQEGRVKQKESNLFQLRKDLEQLEMLLYDAKKEAGDYLFALGDFAQVAGYSDQHQQNLQRFERQGDNQSQQLKYWYQQTQQFIQLLRQVLDLIKEQESIQRQLKELDQRLGRLAEKIDHHRKEQRHWLQSFHDERERTVQLLGNWRAHAPFSLSDELYRKSLRQLSVLYEEVTRFEDVLQPIYEGVQLAQQDLNNQLYPLRGQLKATTEEIAEKQSEQEAWRKDKDPEPWRSKKRVANRTSLKAQGITFAPLYSCVDFKEDVSQAQRNKLEGALKASGILDALVADVSLPALVDDRQLNPLSEVRFSSVPTLSQYLKAEGESALPVRLIEEVLMSIDVYSDLEVDNENKAWSLSLGGDYQALTMKGQAPDNYQASFIGQASRDRYRQEKIAELEQEIHVLEATQAQLEASEQQLLAALKEIDEAVTRLPDDRNMAVAYSESQKAQQQVELIDGQINQTQQELTQHQQLTTQLAIQINQLMTGISLEKSRGAFEDALANMDDYQGTFNDWQGIVMAISHHLDQSQQKKDLIDHQQQDLQFDYDNLQQLKRKVSGLEQQLASNLERQQLTNVAEIEARFQQVFELIQKGSERREAIVPEIMGVTEESSVTAKKVEQLASDLAFYQPFAALWQEMFAAEAGRYPWSTDQTPESLGQALLSNWQRGDNRLNRYQGDFDSKHRELEGDLLEYRLDVRDEPILAEPSWVGAEEVNDDFTSEIELWRHLNYQRILRLDAEGAWRSPYGVLDSLRAQIEQSQLILRKGDEELFEEIILNSVGKVLRALVSKAQKWGHDMNKMLEGQDNSSGLTLSIKWRPKGSDTEEELPTAELVRLLRKDTGSLKEEDLNTMKRHFQAKIARAKKMRDESEEDENLYQVLQQVLDYRDWFSFELSFHRENEGTKPLSNNYFNKFSGGEKAISMYLPLFTAVYSRYKEARNDAPMIITLDEAFAGIDDLNIAQLFKATEQLGFNYMMNSQALYGEYETVSSLNTYELIRSRNANFVSTIHYHWNGRSKELILPDSMSGEGVL